MTRPRHSYAWMALPTVVALAGCTVGPDYVRPGISTPAGYAGAPVADATPSPELARWWKQLRDPVLDDLIRRALAGNPGLKAAQSRVRQARASQQATAAAALPSLSASGDVLDLNKGSATLASLPLPAHSTIYSAGFDAAWEVDLFGGNRRARAAAQANTSAAEWARRGGQVSLVAEVARDYLTLRMLQARIMLGQAGLRRRQGLLALAQARRASGFVTKASVNQQTTALVGAAEPLPQLAAEAAGQIHALSVLVGQPPAFLGPALVAVGAQDGAGQDGPSLPPSPPPLPIGLPSDLLRRRPDIGEAEQRLAAANAQIGVHEAALYPRLNLRALASFGSMALGDIFAGQNLVAGGLGMLSQPLFNGGRTRAAITIAREEDAQALYAYQTTVFTAFAEVEDALARYKAEGARRDDLARAVAAASGDLAIAQSQYRTGFVPETAVLQAEAALLTRRDQLVWCDGAIAVDLIALYKALGGGWSDTAPAAPA